MAQMAGDSDMREKRLVDHLDGSLKKSMTEVMAELTDRLHGKMTNSESMMQHQWEVFEKEVGEKIVQLEPRSVDGTIFAIEYRIRMSVQTDMDKKWSDRNEQERDIEFGGPAGSFRRW